MTTLDLNGSNVTLPDNGFFNNQLYLNGSDNVTNSGGANATLSEGGGGSGNAYSGTISDGNTHTTAITHTSGYVDMAGVNSYSGGTNLQGGTIAISNNSALGGGVLTMSGGTTLQAAVSGLSFSNFVTLNGTDAIDTNGSGNAFALSGTISGSGTLDAVGGGQLTLSGVNSYAGGTLVGNGTFLVVSSDNNLGATSGGITLNNSKLFFTSSMTLNSQRGMVLQGTAGSTLANGNFAVTIAGIISGNQQLIKGGSGTLTLSNANTYSGGTLLEEGSGTTVIGNNSAFGTGVVTIIRNSTLQAGVAGLTIANNMSLDSVNIDTNGNVLTLTGVIGGQHGSLVKINSGTLVLSGANTYGGSTLLMAGTLVVGSNTALGSGILYMTSGTTVQAGASGLALINSIVLSGSNTFDTNGYSLTLSGLLSGNSGSLIKTGSGTLQLTYNDSYFGGTFLTAGTLELGSFGSIAGGVTFNGLPATLQFDTGTNQIANNIAGASAGDNIDLRFQAFASGDKMVWQQSGATGTLMLETFGGSVLQSLTLAGQYSSANFTAGSDNHGGTVIDVVPLPNPAPPASTTAVMIMNNPSTGAYEIYDVGHNAILAAYSLGQVGTSQSFVGLGTFQAGDSHDMLLRDTSTGAFEAEYISGNSITGTAAVGTVGTDWNFAGVGNFDAASSLSELLLRNASSGAFELYHIAGGGVLSGSSVAAVGNNFSVKGFGQFSETATTQMMMQDNTADASSGQLELYTYQPSTASFAGTNVGKVGSNLTIVGMADLLGNGLSQMVMQQNNGNFWLYSYNASSNTLSGQLVGAIGSNFHVVGFGPLGSSGQDEMLMQDAAGDFEVYQYNAGLNAFVGTSMGAVGAPWVVDGIAPNASSGAVEFAPYQSAADVVGSSAESHSFGDDLQGSLDAQGSASLQFGRASGEGLPQLQSLMAPMAGILSPDSAAEVATPHLAGSITAAMSGLGLLHQN